MFQGIYGTRAGGKPTSIRLSGFWISIVGCTALLACSVTAVSLWIDEGYIAWVVDHGSLAAVACALAEAAIRPADRQYPLYDIWEWAWVRLFGSSEYALRASNLPFAAVYVVALALTSRYVFNRRFAWIPFAFVPFIWYYMNEARPYMMLAALATCAVAVVVAFAFGSDAVSARVLPLILPSIFCASFTHILAIMVFPGLVVILFASRREGATRWREWWKSLLIWALPLAAVAAFYGCTLIGNGAKAEISNNQNRAPSPVASAAEIAYEQFGFAGLGPARNTLRTEVRVGDFLEFLPWIGLGLLGISFCIYYAWREGTSRATSVLLVAWMSSFAFAIIMAEAMHARFLGRHMAATMPLLVFAVMSFLRARVGLIALTAVFFVSDLRLSILPTYAKDDYRSTVAALVDRVRLRPGAIDWAADDLTGSYYGLKFAYANPSTLPAPVAGYARALAIDVANHSANQIEPYLRRQLSSGRPVYLAISKPDLFDDARGWDSIIRRRGMMPIDSFTSFKIYEFFPDAALRP